MRKSTIRWNVLGILLSAGVLTGCGDDAPVGPVIPCTGDCVTEFRIDLENLILTINDTVRLSARPVTADGRQLGTNWSVWFGPLRVDSSGLVTPLAAGRGGILARGGEATDYPNFVAQSEILVVDPDTSAQPFIATFQNAATGDTLLRRNGFKGVDSIDIAVSYVIGLQTETLGPPALTFEIRAKAPDGIGPLLSSKTIPAPVRGKAAFVTFRVNLTERNPDQSRRFPPDFYDFFVVLPLADGRLLGQLTGYPVSF